MSKPPEALFFLRLPPTVIPNTYFFFGEEAGGKAVRVFDLRRDEWVS